MRDGQQVRLQSEKGNSLDTRPKNQMCASVAAMQKIGVLELLNPEREVRGSDEQMQQMAKTAKANSGILNSSMYHQ